MSQITEPPKPKEGTPSPLASPWLRAIALVALGLAVGQVFFGLKIETTTVYLVLIAGVALVFPEIQKFSFGKDGLSFERFDKRLQQLDQKVDAVRAGASELSNAITSGVGGKTANPAVPDSASVAAEKLAPADPDDPQAGQWGGKASARDRRVEAKVLPSSLRDDWFKIELAVESTNPNKPLTGTVTFHLHPSFRENPITRPVIGGRARLELLGWGAFTVGVEADEGITRLEINLAGIADAPEAFRTR